MGGAWMSKEIRDMIERHPVVIESNRKWTLRLAAKRRDLLNELREEGECQVQALSENSTREDGKSPEDTEGQGPSAVAETDANGGDTGNGKPAPA